MAKTFLAIQEDLKTTWAELDAINRTDGGLSIRVPEKLKDRLTKNTKVKERDGEYTIHGIRVDFYREGEG